MPKWKCDICGTEFDNFQAQGFDNKIYCPLCFYKHEFNNLNKGIDELITEYYKLKIVNDELLEEATENNNNVKMQIYTQCIRYIKHTIESLEKLKGE